MTHADHADTVSEASLVKNWQHKQSDHAPVIFLLAFCYLTWILWPLPLLLVAAALFFAFKSSWRAGVLCLLLSPPVLLPAFNAGWGAVDYWRGAARLHVYGTIPDFENLDPDTRCYRATFG